MIIPERRAAEVTPAVCKASAGAVEHLPIARVRNLADFLARGQGGGLLGLRRGGRRDAPATTSRTTPAASSPCSARRARGCATRVASMCDDLVSLPLRGRIESLNVSATAAVLLYEMLQQRLDAST